MQSKIPSAYGSTWNIWMPNWLGIYWSGGLENGIHALPILPNGGILWEGFPGPAHLLRLRGARHV